jgi:hypothetical protein
MRNVHYRSEDSPDATNDGASAAGILAYAHLRHAADSPDPTWQHISDWILSKHITFVFSDHTLRKSNALQADPESDGEENEPANKSHVLSEEAISQPEPEEQFSD